MNNEVPRTKLVLKILHITAWVIFIGLCIKTGAILYSLFASLAIDPETAKNLFEGLDLSDLYRFNVGHYITVVTFAIFISGLQAFMFYLIIKIFLKINIVHPFSVGVSLLISRISYITVVIGIITIAGNSYCEWLATKGVVFPDIQVYLGTGGEFLLMGAIIFMIAQVFKKGIEIQTENELTV